MGGGIPARSGFRFQDLYLLLRLLREIGESFEQESLLVRPAVRFGIEAKTAALKATTVNDEPDWDVLVQSQRDLEVIEVKSGEISRNDRIAFWCRLRKELSTALADTRMRPVLVTDPNRMKGLENWRELATLAGHHAVIAPESAPRRVDSANDLLTEALWYLCKASDADKTRIGPAAGIDGALATLSRFRVELHIFDELNNAVLRSVELLFANGFSDQIQDSILGWLGSKAVSEDTRGHFFTAADLLEKMGARSYCAALDPITITQWHEFWKELPKAFNALVRDQLGQTGQSVSALLAQPAATAALEKSKSGGCLLLGKAGAGKTTFLAQCAQQARDSQAEVFCVSADALNENELESLVRLLRFRRGLLALRFTGQPFWIGIDGLDEIDGSARKRWALHLSRLALDEKTTVVATVREGTWEADPILRHHLGSARCLTVEEWPEDLVRHLLNATSIGENLSQSLLGLLRQPLFLDLFWRTFVERPTTSYRALCQMAETRHGLLAAFWQERILISDRHQVPELTAHLDEIFRHAAGSIGAFAAEGLNAEALAMLRSESVLLTEGALNPRLRFRHPLLRDFALALWCLRAEIPEEVARRWQSICGGLQRQGALRAIFEAVLNLDAPADFPEIDVNRVLIALLCNAPSSATHVAQLLGSLAPETALDPATWPWETCAALPASFGRELLATAQLAGNGGWAERLVHWPSDAPWIDSGFPETLYCYANYLYSRAQQERGNAILVRQARQAAYKLRSLAEQPRFATVFSETHRWLKSMMFSVIIPLLPDEGTFTWLEREMAALSSHARGSLLEQMVYLANADASRTANICRQAVGLGGTAARPTLDATCWNSLVVERQAIDWLTGDDGRRGLVVEHPREFLPMALDLAEALFIAEDTSTTNEQNIGVLRDDLPRWGNFWDEFRSENLRDRCLKAIRQAGESVLESDLATFLREFCPSLRQSPSAAVQSIYLDLLLQRADDPECAAAARACLFDPRLYYIRGLLYWIETALRQHGPGFSDNERVTVLECLDEAVRTFPPNTGGEHFRAQLLAALPRQDLPLPYRSILAEWRPNDNYLPTAHPRTRFEHVLTDWSPAATDHLDADRSKGWPMEFDSDALQKLSCASRALSDNNASIEKVSNHLPRAIAAVQTLLPTLAQQSELLNDHNHFWVWQALATSVEKGFYNKIPGLAPPANLLLDCAHFALIILEEREIGLQEKDPSNGVYSDQESPWLCALHLADAVLVWQLMQADETLQHRFEQVLRKAFATNNSAVQVAVTMAVRPCHWLRDDSRISLQDELIWNQPRQSNVLAWSFSRLHYESDDRRTQILRRLLNRGNIEGNLDNLTELMGRTIGSLAICLLDDVKRSAAAGLIEEVLISPDQWLFLRDPAVQKHFLGSVAFGMKETAARLWSHTELAADFGAWNLAIWRRLSLLQVEDYETDNVILFASHWLIQDYREPPPEAEKQLPPNPVALRQWWENLLPFWRAVVEDGSRRDVHQLLFNFRPKQLNHVLRPEEVFNLVETLLGRLEADIENRDIHLDQTSPERNDYRSWRQNLSEATDALDALHKDDLLQTDPQRERAYRLLRRLADPPFRIQEALSVIYRLHAGQT